MKFTEYYFNLGYTETMASREKIAGIFTDDNGNLTTGTKIGLGALGLGAAGLAGYGLSQYLDHDTLDNVAEGSKDFIGPMPKHVPVPINAQDLENWGIDGGLIGKLNEAKEAVVDTGKGIGMAAKESLHDLKDGAIGLKNAIMNQGADPTGIVHQALYGNLSALQQAQERIRQAAELRRQVQ